MDPSRESSPAAGNSASGGKYQKLLFRLRCLGRPIATWLETAPHRPVPAIGERIGVTDHLAALRFGATSSARVIALTPLQDLLVVHLSVEAPETN